MEKNVFYLRESLAGPQYRFFEFDGHHLRGIHRVPSRARELCAVVGPAVWQSGRGVEGNYFLETMKTGVRKRIYFRPFEAIFIWHQQACDYLDTLEKGELIVQTFNLKIFRFKRLSFQTLKRVALICEFNAQSLLGKLPLEQIIADYLIHEI